MNRTNHKTGIYYCFFHHQGIVVSNRREYHTQQPMNVHLSIDIILFLFISLHDYGQMVV